MEVYFCFYHMSVFHESVVNINVELYPSDVIKCCFQVMNSSE